MVKIFIKSFLFIIVIILTLLTNGILERILLILSGVLLHHIVNKLIYTRFIDYKRVIIGIIVGYLFANIMLISNKYEVTYERLKNKNIDENKSAIILLYDVEAPHYNPKYLIKNFIDDNSFPHFLKLSINLYKNKVFSEKNGENINTYYSKLLAEKLQNHLNVDYTVYRSYINQSPYIEETIQEAINDGNGQIIITPISLVETEDIKRYQSITKSNLFQVENVRFKHINYLWDSDLLAESYLEKISSGVMATDKSRVGVVLVGEQFNNKNLNEIYIKQDVLFREKISSLLKKHGYDNNKVRLSFLNEKLIKEELERLMEYGVGQIIIVSVSNESQKNSSLKMIRNLVKSIDAPQGIKFTQIYGWEPNAYILEELLKRIELVKYKSNK